MIQIALMLSGGHGAAQMLSSTMELTKSKTSSVVLQPVVVKDHSMKYLFKVSCRRKIGSWIVEQEGSTIEKLYPRGVYYDARANHFNVSQMISKSFEGRYHASVSFANHSFWNVTTTALSRNTLDLSVITRVGKNSTIELDYENWSDGVSNSFEMGTVYIAPGHYSFSTWHAKYSWNNAIYSQHVETRIGKFYELRMASMVMGSKVIISPAIQLNADIDYSVIFNESRTSAFRSTFNLKFKPNKYVSSSLFVINNGFMALTGVFANVCLSKRAHQVTLEYRDLRNVRLDYITSGNWMFASRWLMQYRYNF